MFFSSLRQKKEPESGILLKINELENVMGSQKFLYGSLHSIKQYMLSHSQMEAAQYLTEFTNLLKIISKQSKQKTVSLAEELEITLLYLELEKKRLGEQFQFFIQSDEALPTDRIWVNSLFLFKKVEELCENQIDKQRFQILLVIRKFGRKLECIVENEGLSSYIFRVNIPSDN